MRHFKCLRLSGTGCAIFVSTLVYDQTTVCLLLVNFRVGVRFDDHVVSRIGRDARLWSIRRDPLDDGNFRRCFPLFRRPYIAVAETSHATVHRPEPYLWLVTGGRVGDCSPGEPLGEVGRLFNVTYIVIGLFNSSNVKKATLLCTTSPSVGRHFVVALARQTYNYGFASNVFRHFQQRVVYSV